MNVNKVDVDQLKTPMDAYLEELGEDKDEAN